MARSFQEEDSPKNCSWNRSRILPTIQRSQRIHLLRPDTLPVHRPRLRNVPHPLRCPEHNPTYRRTDLFLHHRQSWSSTTSHLRRCWHNDSLYHHRHSLWSLLFQLARSHGRWMGLRRPRIPLHADLWNDVFPTRLGPTIRSIQQCNSSQGSCALHISSLDLKLHRRRRYSPHARIRRFRNICLLRYLLRFGRNLGLVPRSGNERTIT